MGFHGEYGWFAISVSFLWVIVVIQGMILVGLLRQVGVLSLRIHPAGARVTDDSVPIGENIPVFEALSIGERTERTVLPDLSARTPLMYVFVSPGCSACGRVMTGVRTLMGETNGSIHWAVISFGDPAECEIFRRDHRLAGVNLFSADMETRAKLRIHAVPFALLVNSDGQLMAKGIVNHLEHLESLLTIVHRDPQLSLSETQDEKP